MIPCLKCAAGRNFKILVLESELSVHLVANASAKSTLCSAVPEEVRDVREIGLGILIRADKDEGIRRLLFVRFFKKPRKVLTPAICPILFLLRM